MNILIKLFNQIKENREHIVTFIKRDIKLARANTKLGLFWIIFPPLVPLTVFIGLASLEVISRSADMPFVMYIVIGITFYRFMTQLISTTISIFRSEGSTLKNFNVPLIVLMVSKNAMTFFHLIFRLIIVFIVVVYYGVEIRLEWLLLPIFLIFIIMFSFSIGVIVSFKNLLYKDYGKGMDLIMAYTFFMSSVIFPFPKDGWLGVVNSFNPFNTFVDFTRGLFYHGISYLNFITLSLTFLISLLLFLYSCNLIYNSQDKIKSAL